MKKVKSKNSLQHLFCSKQLERQRALGSGGESSITRLLPWEPHRHHGLGLSRQSSLNCVCEHLCFLLIYFVHPLTRCASRYQKSLREFIFGVWENSEFFAQVLMVIASSLYFFLTYERVQRYVLLSIAGETFIHYRAAHFLC